MHCLWLLINRIAPVSHHSTIKTCHQNSIDITWELSCIFLERLPLRLLHLPSSLTQLPDRHCCAAFKLAHFTHVSALPGKLTLILRSHYYFQVVFHRIFLTLPSFPRLTYFFISAVLFSYGYHEKVLLITPP